MSMKKQVLAGPTPLDALHAPDFDLEDHTPGCDDDKYIYEDECEHKQADDRDRADDINLTLNGGW